jgi:hypothetical protein
MTASDAVALATLTLAVVFALNSQGFRWPVQKLVPTAVRFCDDERAVRLV